MKTILSFLTVGALSAVINMAVFAGCMQVMPQHYQAAVSIAYVMSVVFHFLANRHFTFKRRHISMHLQLPKYLSMVGINYVVTLLVMYVVVSALQQSPYLGIVIAIGATVGGGYLLSRYWVFE